MAADILYALVLTPLESAINALLQSDPVTCQALQRLSGKIIQIEADDLQQSVFILPFNAGMQLQSHIEGEADVTLSGSSNRLLQLLSSDNKAELFFGNGISVTGESALANQFQNLLADTRIDWEGLLAEHTGDLAAHQISDAVKGQISFVKHVSDSLRENLHEYIQEELRILPTRPETDAFMDAVDNLKDRTDRLTARIHVLQQKQSLEDQG
ncbi:ubiquinone biosynthesis accessory factor UbiJ [Neptunomonas antarctica]|uniref:Ubiquinone biosynthesis accessory factor UbiJ n=1 Tax=Neptunomonas antarctica TaxID=619304 RepID=A0A1N7J2R4_9GAMM|nr:SCP2 sterol-binding domain-containing protein [Neptunomonas antarctica]SIS43594.1 ubiquinone biosynthesis protein UbiJ [Neptunomonas antarctica]